MTDTVIRFEEEAIFKLRYLYKRHGYLPYKMSKFEEYELYSRNKDFLVSDRVITFNDTDGKLMALKPDVTLSIIKNGEDIKGVKQKVYYDERVYRVSDSTRHFKEILQTGLECIGDIDLYDIYEVITLAAESLSNISDSYYLDVSSLDLVYSVVSSACGNYEFIRRVTECLSQKNTHDLKSVCGEYSVSEENYRKIAGFISLGGKRSEVIAGVSELCGAEAVRELRELSQMLDNSPFSHRIRFDFSVISDMSYYNGFVFNGFIDGICSGVLAGGQYGNMMKKMSRDSEAVGFALYLDRLEDLDRSRESYDVDCLLLYDGCISPAELAQKVDSLIARGISVSAQKSVPPKLRYKNAIDLRQQEGENNA